MDADHGSIVKIFEREVNSLLRRKEERQPLKKKGQICLEMSFPIFLLWKIPSKRMMCTKNNSRKS